MGGDLAGVQASQLCCRASSPLHGPSPVEGEGTSTPAEGQSRAGYHSPMIPFKNTNVQPVSTMKNIAHIHIFSFRGQLWPFLSYSSHLERTSVREGHYYYATKQPYKGSSASHHADWRAFSEIMLASRDQARTS
jgi:hypothetical protein